MNFALMLAAFVNQEEVCKRLLWAVTSSKTMKQEGKTTFSKRIKRFYGCSKCFKDKTNTQIYVTESKLRKSDLFQLLFLNDLN